MDKYENARRKAAELESQNIKPNTQTFAQSATEDKYARARQKAAQLDAQRQSNPQAARASRAAGKNSFGLASLAEYSSGDDYTWYQQRLKQLEQEETKERARNELKQKGLDEYLREAEMPSTNKAAGAGGGGRPAAHMKGGFNALHDARQAEERDANGWATQWAPAAKPARYNGAEDIETVNAAELAPWNSDRSWTPEGMYQRKLEEIGAEQEQILDTVMNEGRTQTAEERARLNELTEQEKRYVAALQRYATQAEETKTEPKRYSGISSAYTGEDVLTDEQFRQLQGRYQTALENADLEDLEAVRDRMTETAGRLEEQGAGMEDEAEAALQTEKEQAYARLMELYAAGKTDSEEYKRLNAIVAGQEWTGGPQSTAGKQAQELSTQLYGNYGTQLTRAKTENYFQEQGEKYQAIRSTAQDFDLYSDPYYNREGQKLTFREKMGGGTDEYKAVNHKAFGQITTGLGMTQNLGAAMLMTPDEREMYNYLYNSPEHGKEEAHEYLEYKRREHLDADYTNRKNKIIDYAIENSSGLENAALNVAAVTASTVGGIPAMVDATVQNAKNLFRSDENYVPVNRYSEWQQLNLSGNYIQNQQAQMLNDKYGTVNVPILGKIGWGTALSVGDSILQSQLAAATGQPWLGGAMLGASAGANAMQEAYDRGATDGQALLYAYISGINEMLFEEVSLDKLIKMRDTEGLKTWIMNTLKQGAIEGSEEGFTTLANTLADKIVMGDKSQIETRMRELHEEGGYTLEEAKKLAWKEWAQSLAMDVAMGSAAGLGGAGATAAVTGSSKAIYNRSVNREAGEGIISQDNAQAIVDIANTMGDGSKAKKAAAKVAGQIKDGKIKAGDIGKLYREVRQEMGEKSAEPIRQAIGMDVKNRLRELGVNEDTLQQLADGLVDLFAGKKLDDAAGQAIAGSNVAMQVMRELMGTGREDRSAWAEDALRKNEAAMAAAQQVDELRNATRKKMAAQPESRATKAGNMDMRRAAEQTQGLSRTNTEKSRITDIKTGKKKAVDIIGVKLDEDGVPTVTVRAEDGSTEDVNYRDVEYGTDAPAALVTAAAEYGKNAQKILDAWNPASKQQMSDYIKGMQTATRMARAGVSLETIQNTVTAITAQQANVAYQIGREMGTEALAAQEATPEQKQAQRDKAKGGNLTYTKGAREAIDMGMLNGRQQKDLKAVQALAEALQGAGVSFKVYQSREENGTYRIVDEDIAREIGQQVGEQAANGAYKDGTVYIDLNAGLSAAVKDGSMMRTVSHEVTHHIFRNGNREEVQALKDFVADRIARDGIELLGKKMSFDEYVETMQATRGLDYDAAVEEVVADASEMMLQNSTAVQELAQQNRSLFQRIRDRVTAWINAIRSAFEGVEANSREAKAMLQYADEMQQVWDTALKGALEFQEAAEEAGKDLGPAVELAQQGETEARAELPAEEAARAVETDENSMMAEAPESHKDVALSARDEYGAPMFNLRTMEEDMEFYLDDLRKMGMDTTELDELAQNLIKTMDIVRKNMDALDFDYDVAASDRPFKPVKVNADQHYKAALDFSTLCPKRVLLQAIVEQLQKELKKNVSMATQVAIRDRLKELRDNALPKIDVACALCYVEAARSGTYRWVNTFLQDRAGALKDYFAKTDRTFMSQTLTEKVNAFKNGETVTVEGVDYKTEHGAYTHNSKGKITKKSMKEENKTSGTRDVKTMEALTKAIRKTYNMSELQEKIIEDAMKISEEQFLSAGGLMKMKKEHFEVYDAFVRYLREKSRSKALETRVAYKRGDLLGTRTRSGSLIANQALIKEQNEESGFRLQSWSDFEVIHTLDYIAAIIDLAKAGSKAHAYTKVPNMVRIFGNTGIMFNLSMIPLRDTGFDENGKLAYDPREGMRENVMMELRNKFPETVGNIVIGISDEQIRALMASPDVDYIIPYHVSGASNETRHALGTGAWGDYSATQNEVVPRGKTAPRLRDWFSIEEARAYKGDGYAYMNAAAQKYLDLCAKDGITPKFPQFLTKDSKGNYTAPSGYWKLLIDRKMVNHVTGQVIEQKVVQPKFDFKMMHSIMEAWVGNKTRMQQQEAINRVLDDVRAGRIQVTAENVADAETLMDGALIAGIEKGAKAAKKAQQTEEKAKFQARDNREVTDRELLADAMASIAENDAERQALEAYKEGIQDIANMESELQDTRIKLREAMFGKPKASQQEIEKLQKKRDDLTKKIGKQDERLLIIQRAKPLQNILAREREQYNRQASEKVQQKVQQYREAREDTHNRQVLRNEIARGVRKLDKAVRTPTDSLHVPDGLKNAAAALVGMFTQDDNKIFDREKLLEIQTAYANMAQGGMSEDSGAAGLYDEDIDGMLTQMAETLRDRTVQQLSTSELNDIRNIIDHFQFVIENADTVFMDGRRQHVSQLAENAAEQMRAKGPHVYSRLNTNALARLLGTGELTPTYFSRMIGGTMGDMFNEILRGETQFGREASKARDKVEEIQEKHNYKKWAGKKNDTLTLDTPSGKLTLTREQALGLWATRKREVTNKEQQASHIFTGGVMTEEKVKKGLLGKYTEEGGGTPLTAEEIRKIDEWLTDEQKKYADDMVGYLSREMADLGNETSMRLHGWKKFGEGYYYPYRTSADYRQTRLGDDTEASLIKAMGFTKKTTFRANTPIVISNFTDTCAGHIGKMLLYNAFAEAQDNFMRVYDYKLDKSTTTKGLVKTAWGKDATKYINRFMTDLFGGVTRDENLDMMDFLTNRFKRGAVMANMSVAIQQPTAVLRAMAMVNPKYFIGTAIHKRGSWAEAKKYAGTAVIKDMGKFDTGLGKSATEYIGNQKNHENIAKKAMNGLDFLGGILPEQADKITWAWIWEAVKKEQAAKTGLTGEALLEAAGKRFDDVTRATQVYDSVLAKSQIMRSKDGWSRMVTSFMAEPTLSYNMLLDAVRNKHLTKGQRAASIAAVVAASIATVLAKSLVAGARKRDDDETYLESYISQVVGNLVGSKKTLHLNSELSPLTMVPVLQDILNIIDGYDVERTDMSVISDLVNAVRKLGSDSASSKQKLQTMAGAIGNLTGVPAKNIWRDADAVIGLLDQPELREDAILYAFREGLGYDDSKAAFAERAVQAYADGDMDDVKYDLDHMKNFLKMDEKSIQTKMKSAVKAAYLDEDISWTQAEDMLVKYCGTKDKDAAYWEVEKWGYNESKSDEDPDYTKYQDLYAAIDANGSITEAKKELTQHGYDAKDVVSAAKSYIGSQYKDGEITRAQAEAKYKKYCEMDADETYWKLRELDYAKAHKGSTDGYGKYADYLGSIMTGGKNMQKYMNELLDHGVEAKTIASQITSEYKPIYLEYLKKGDTTSAANLQAKLLAAYELLGYDRNKKLKDIRAWEKDLEK